jgi:hypothetical protein
MFMKNFAATMNRQARITWKQANPGRDAKARNAWKDIREMREYAKYTRSAAKRTYPGQALTCYIRNALNLRLAAAEAARRQTEVEACFR